MDSRAASAWSSAPRAISSTDRKSTRLNSSHLVISYAVFCLKKKKAYGHHKATSLAHSLTVFVYVPDCHTYRPRDLQQESAYSALHGQVAGAYLAHTQCHKHT